MKKLTLFLLLSISIVATATTSPSRSGNTTSKSYTPMLVEGRTWWYTQMHRIFPYVAENGISVGEEIEIDGVKWHKIHAVNTGFNNGGVWSYNFEPRTIAYMREDGDKIYTAYFDEFVPCEGIDYYYSFITDPNENQLTFQYKNIGESYRVGTTNYNERYITINDIRQITNSGNNYKLYVSTLDTGYDVSFIEGLGCISDLLFFVPDAAIVSAENMYLHPELRYVTEGGNIIYEGIGGYKLWEESSVGDVIAESNDNFIRWYNLQGMEIDKPTTSGVYIRSSNSGNEKVYIR